MRMSKSSTRTIRPIFRRYDSSNAAAVSPHGTAPETPLYGPKLSAIRTMNSRLKQRMLIHNTLLLNEPVVRDGSNYVVFSIATGYQMFDKLFYFSTTCPLACGFWSLLIRVDLGPASEMIAVRRIDSSVRVCGAGCTEVHRRYWWKACLVELCARCHANAITTTEMRICSLFV